MSVPYYPGSLFTPNFGLALFGMDEVLAENFVIIDDNLGGGGGGGNLSGTLTPGVIPFATGVNNLSDGSLTDDGDGNLGLRSDITTGLGLDIGVGQGSIGITVHDPAALIAFQTASGSIFNVAPSGITLQSAPATRIGLLSETIVQAKLILGDQSIFTGIAEFRGSTGGAAQITVAASAGTPNPLVLPTTTGSSGFILTTNGANPQLLTWSDPSTIAGGPFVKLNPSGNQSITGAFQLNMTDTGSSLNLSGVLSSSKAGAASASAVSITGLPFTGGSGTTTFPLVYINSGTAPTTWNTSGTLLGINAPSGFTGNIIDYHNNGGVTTFSVSNGGTLLIQGGGSYTFSARSRILSPSDGVLQLTNTALTGFTRLQLGLTTSSGPAFGVSGTTITSLLGDGTSGGTFVASGVLSSTGAGAASASAVSITGAVFTGGSGTTTFPLVYINQGTGPTTFSTAGTYLGINTVTGFTGNFIDCHLNGGGSIFQVLSSGSVVSSGNITVSSAGAFLVNTRSKWNSAADGDITLLNNAGTSFSNLKFGGTTSSFPALNVSGTVFTVQLADGTAGGTFNSPAYQAGGTAGVTAGAFTTITSITTKAGLVTALSGSSDERLKNHAPYTGGLEEILAITPAKYRWNKRGQKQTGLSGDQEFVGFIAQDVQRVIPEAITATEKAKDGDEEFLSLDDRPIIAALVNAVKALAARVQELERK